jgi:hypothetical protein
MGYASVVVVPTDDRFEVIVTEGDSVTRRDFDFADSAESYASGQRFRLGLPADGRAGRAPETTGSPLTMTARGS